MCDVRNVLARPYTHFDMYGIRDGEYRRCELRQLPQLALFRITDPAVVRCRGRMMRGPLPSRASARSALGTMVMGRIEPTAIIVLPEESSARVTSHWLRPA